MPIARAIERITRRAQEGGLIAVLTSVGEELRGEAIPRPLRQVAQRIATLLDGKRSALASGTSGAEAAVVVNVAVAVAVGADPAAHEGAATPSTSKPVIATAVAMSPQGETREADADPAPRADDAPEPGEGDEAAWRSGLAPRE